MSVHTRQLIASLALCAMLTGFSGCGTTHEDTVPSAEVPVMTTATEPVSPMEAEVSRVIETVSRHQSENSFTFLAVSDTCENDSNAAGNRLAGEAAAAIRNSVDMDFAALLGDIVHEDVPQFQYDLCHSEVISGYFKDAFDGIPNFFPRGEKDIPLEGIVLSLTPLRDFPEYKLRVISLDTGDGFLPANRLQQFAEALDLSQKEDADEWGILILSHMPLDFGGLLDSAGRILDAYLSGTAVSLIQEETTVEYDFTGKNAAEIIANIHGHSRCLRYDSLYVANEKQGMYRSPIVRICIPNAGSTGTNHLGRNEGTDSNGIEYGEAETYEKIPETEDATAFNVITVDRAAKIIHCVNFGAGYDREIPYADGLLSEIPASGTPAPAGEYTNQVPISTEFGRRNNRIFNESGYRNHTYLVCNDIEEEPWPYGNDAEYVTTGAIPFTVPSYLTPPVIYIWGAALDEADHTRFFIYDSQKYRLVLQATGAEFKNYFTIEQLAEQYYKLTPIPEGKASVLFPATNGRAGKGSIAFSLKGTGENLVITVGEPIIPE